MSVEFRCPNCGKVARGPETLIGQRVKCPNCEHVFVAEADPQAEPLPPPRAGDVVGPYRLQRMLGEGAMGSVFLAYDNKLQMEVAVKLPKGASGASADPRRFRREAKALAALDHPNICPVYAVGEHDRRLCIAMRYVAGTPLSSRVGPGKLWEPARACELVRTIARAMQHAHDKKVIHRDLKPGNIMLTADGAPVVMDFGLAKLEHEDASRLTASGSVFGTLAYMPPEQARGELERIGRHSDIYSLGVILFELVSGRLPYTGRTVHNVLIKVANDPVPQLRSVLPSADARLEAICLKAMAKEATDRYPSMAEFADALHAYLEPPRPVREDTWVSPTTGMKFVRIPAGTFLMGSTDLDVEADDEKPQHSVTLTKDFLIGVHPVTVAQFRRFAGATHFSGGYWQSPGLPQTDDHPVVNVSWDDAAKFCEWLSKRDGQVYRLPTEAEWEYSCRGGSTSKYHFGDDPADLLRYANFNRLHGGTSPVGTFLENPFHLHDMHGNVWEWCADLFGNYLPRPITDPKGPDNGSSRRVIRGGAWNCSAWSSRSASRSSFGPSNRDYALGFRVARVLSDR